MQNILSQVDRHGWLRSHWKMMMAYPLTGVIVLATFAAVLFIQTDVHYVAGPLFMLSVIGIVWTWGSGPGIVSVILQFLAISYWFVLPSREFTVRYVALYSCIPFFVIQIAIVMTTYLLRNKSQQCARDREHLRESNRRLEQANATRNEMISRIAHELKTPITVIQGYAQLTLRILTRRRDCSHCVQADVLESINKNCHAIKALIDDLLAIRHTPQRLCTQPCDLCLICQVIVDEQKLLNDRVVHLSCLPPIVLQLDERRFSQVITNLLSNALKYSSPPLMVSLCVRQQDSEVVIAVHNDGSVILPEQQCSIFEPFYRAPGAESVAGWGLGLAISKEIVLMHSGRIWVESSEESGTTFFVALPMVVA